MVSIPLSTFWNASIFFIDCSIFASSIPNMDAKPVEIVPMAANDSIVSNRLSIAADDLDISCMSLCNCLTVSSSSLNCSVALPPLRANVSLSFFRVFNACLALSNDLDTPLTSSVSFLKPSAALL